jgi:two-component system, NarL family, sensor histidine kinase UhpB
VTGPSSNFKNRAQSLLQRFVSVWQGRPMLWQLLAVSAVIQCIAAAIAGAIIIYDVRQEALAEMTNTLIAAEKVVTREIERVSGSAQPAKSIENIPFDFEMVRNVDIEIYSAERKLVRRQHWADESDNADVPRWFVRIVAPKSLQRHLPVEIDGRHIGSVLLIAQLPDDIEDVWDGFLEFAILTIGLNFLVFLLLFFALSRIVSPLRMLVQGLHNLERGHYNVHLPRPSVYELATITDRVNALSVRLRNVRMDNLALSRRLITIQDDERREIAAELHDELGPYLFGLSAELTSLRGIADTVSEANGHGVNAHVEKLLGLVHRIQDLNRQLLGKLRPMSIGKVSLADALAGLLAELETFKGETAILLNAAGLAVSYGETVDLTIYRCVREGVVNAIRHASSKKIGIRVYEHCVSEHGGKMRSLSVIVEDDGRGISPTVSLGYGLTGIRERVRALGGTMTISPVQSGGTKLEIRIPLESKS